MFAERVALVVILAFGASAWAQDGGVVDGGVAAEPLVDGGVVGAEIADGGSADGGSAATPVAALKTARDEFEFGNYEGVVARLRPLVDALELSHELPEKADRLEALRVYGIACTLTGRKTAAEGAFLLLLREEPSTRLDPALVRPEAVAFFEQVRARHRAELVAVYRKGRRPHYWVVDLIPIAGQLQNRQWKKALAFGAAEAALLATNITTGVLLDSYAGDQHTFAGHTKDYAPLVAVNYTSFALLVGVTVAGIIDAFAVGARRLDRERKAEAQLGY